MGAGDIRDAMTDEVDFIKEAKNIADFQNYVDRNGLSSVATSPFVYTQHSSRRCVLCSWRASAAAHWSQASGVQNFAPAPLTPRKAC